MPGSRGRGDEGLEYLEYQDSIWLELSITTYERYLLTKFSTNL